MSEHPARSFAPELLYGNKARSLATVVSQIDGHLVGMPPSVLILAIDLDVLGSTGVVPVSGGSNGRLRGC